MPHLFDDTVGSQSLDQVRRTRWSQPGDMVAKITGSKTGDGPFATHQGDKHIEVLLKKKIETAIGTRLYLGRARESVTGLLAGTWMLDRRHIGKISLIGCIHQFA